MNQVYDTHALLYSLRLRPPIVESIEGRERGEEKPAAARFGPSTRMKQRTAVAVIRTWIWIRGNCYVGRNEGERERPFIAAITA